jgi:RimK family alpha-L-glutamate ligase
MEAAERLGVKPRYLRISRMWGGIRTGLYYGSHLLDVDGAVVRSLGFIVNVEQLERRATLLRQAEMMGRVLINPVEPLLKARDKYHSLLVLERSGVRVPRTAVTEDLGAAVKLVEEWGTVVVKPIIGSMGRGALRISSPDEAFTVFRTLLSLGQPLYIQEYIEKPGRDIRVFTVGGSVVAAAYRYAVPGSWKTNVAQGGRMVAMEPDEQLAETAIRASEALGLEYAGIDVVEAQDGYMVFEANASPLWRGLQEATGVDVAIHIVSRLLELLRR